MEIALIYFAVLALAFFLLMVRPQRRRAAAHRQFVAALSVGDEVITSGGIFGTIRGLGDEVVDLEIASGTVLRIARIAIAQPAAAFTAAPADAAAPEAAGDDTGEPADASEAADAADAEPPSDDPRR
jgi:preprotein translocase subunit YajC